MFNEILWNQRISKENKRKIYNVDVKSILTYDSEVWQLKERIQGVLRATEIDFWKRSLKEFLKAIGSAMKECVRSWELKISRGEIWLEPDKIARKGFYTPKNAEKSAESEYLKVAKRPQKFHPKMAEKFKKCPKFARFSS